MNRATGKARGTLASTARTLTFRTLLGRLWVDLQLLGWLLRGGLGMGRYLLRHPRLARAARPRVRAAEESPLPSPDELSLLKLSEGVYTQHRRTRGDADARSPVVLHFTGTGESVYAASEADLGLCARQAGLCDAIHYMFQAPSTRGAYYGPKVFANAMWERVAPIVEHYDGPFVLIGLSRGGLLALDLAVRIVTELGKPASVLSLSPPLDVPRQIPDAVHTIASFEDMLQRLSELLPHASRWLHAFTEHAIGRVHTLLTALVLTDFDIAGPRALTLQLVELAEHGLIQGSLRAAREFRLLLTATRRDCQLFCRELAHATAHNAGRLFVALVWGERDSWLDTPSCAEAMRDAMAREPSHDFLQLATIADHGHALGRTEQGLDALSDWLARVVAQAPAEQTAHEECAHDAAGKVQPEEPS